MAPSRQNAPSAADGPVTALLLSEGSSPDDRNLAALLDFFGISSVSVPIDGLSHGDVLNPSLMRSKFLVLSSASGMATAMQGVQESGGELPEWILGADSVYVYGFQDK